MDRVPRRGGGRMDNLETLGKKPDVPALTFLILSMGVRGWF